MTLSGGALIAHGGSAGAGTAGGVVVLIDAVVLGRGSSKLQPVESGLNDFVSECVLGGVIFKRGRRLNVERLALFIRAFPCRPRPTLGAGGRGRRGRRWRRRRRQHGARHGRPTPAPPRAAAAAPPPLRCSLVEK